MDHHAGVIELTALAQQAPLLPRGYRPCSAAGWADGVASASIGRPQSPYLLDAYGARRAPWNVAGVDYRVGVKEGQSLTPWQNILSVNSGPGVQVNQSTGLIYVIADSPSSTFKNIDFSTGIGCIVYNPSGNGTFLTFINCKFGPVKPWSIYNGSYFINDQNSAAILVLNCTFDGSGMSAQPSFIVSSGPVTLMYNWFTNSFGGQILQFNGNGQLIYKYNFIDTTLVMDGAHKNILQLSGTGTCNGMHVSYNTAFQKDLAGGEFFQVYTNAASITLTNPVFGNNTIIALPAACNMASVLGDKGPQTMSNLIHGSGGTTTVTGGQNKNNYFDVSGAFGAYYGGTMVTGWTSTNNRNMRTGLIIAPA